MMFISNPLIQATAFRIRIQMAMIIIALLFPASFLQRPLVFVILADLRLLLVGGCVRHGVVRLLNS